MSKSVKSKIAAKQSRPRNGHRRSISVIAALIVVIAIFAASRLQPVAHAFALATSRQPEGYTELSFNTSAAHPLPSSAPVGMLEHFSFHIANHEARSMTYRYLVTVGISGDTSQVDSGTVTLADGKAANVTADFSMPVASETGIVDVQLANPAQHIFFRTYS